ncbi:bifunctional 2-polyprenyl-6-hydroxyphenol methylase/3-demethylubiquinol 3-O-methyltransferase UbiG [Pseudochrobactrum sp. XF203]|uniref:class I SAM-dependent methyltransferase n=1 Tax=Pseudochrobactrum sp. XF203 TaxID=2879116 RepID=UPI001CE27D5F|nr:class I SAM-dependent methyltransferase [Pseudochrobactrum sp. XF203]UCA47069.1 class I SAM-dependent methyltransferase [Pseudochrobactrum sp. XF203]
MQTLPFTGERYVPEIAGEIRLEHIHRYAWARDLVNGLDVLDIASGEGFGSAILSETAKTVTGVDISEEAVLHAQKRYGNLASFLVGAANEIPMEDNSVDAVISFETIEHVSNHVSMLDEIKRVLRPNGFLMISSPDKEIYTDKAGYVNEFHVSELTFGEFKNLLEVNFNNVRMFGQKITACSIIVDLLHDVENSNGVFYTDGSNGSVMKGLLDKKECKYIISIAANCSDHFPISSNSALFSQVEQQVPNLIKSKTYRTQRDDINGLSEDIYRSEPALRITLSNKFDHNYYALECGLSGMTRLELAMNYLMVGEKAGFSASEHFNATKYLAVNPDVNDYPAGALCHYIDYGEYEGRNLC